VTVDDVAVKAEKPLYLLFHKPKNCVCTSRDEHGRRTVLDFLSGIAQRIYTVGRLDYDAEGLLILTNDGEFAQQVIHPRSGIARRYEVTVKGYFTPDATQSLRRGVTLDGKRIRPLSLRVLSRGNQSSRLAIEICQGINQQVKRMLRQVGYEVATIRRTRIGTVELGDLSPGKFRRMTLSERQSLEGRRSIRGRVPKDADSEPSSKAPGSRENAMRRQ
jgi:pseudouridine synthase